MAGDGYELRRVGVEPADLAPVRDLLGTVFPHARHFTDAVLSWQYKGNPDGVAVGMNAWAGDSLAAHYVTIPLLARMDGQVERGLLSLNTATHPDHQGRKLFTRLAEATYARAAAEGHGFVVGVANANSTPGFTRKLGFQLVRPLLALVGVGPIRFAKHRLAAAFQPLRSEAKVAWRLAHPAKRYHLAASGGGTLVVTHERIGPATYLLGAFPEELAAVGSPRASAPWSKAFIGLEPALDRRAAYVNVPMRLRPSPLNLIFKDLSGRGRSLDPASVSFQAFDFDVL